MRFFIPSIALMMSVSVFPVFSAEENSLQDAYEYLPVELTGSAKVGYSSLYHYRGMVSADSASGGMSFDTELAYQPKVPFAPFMAFSYRDMEVFNSNGQTNFIVGGQINATQEAGSDNENHSMVMFRAGYQLMSGGLPGIMKGWEKNGDLNSSSGTTQEFVLNYLTVIPYDSFTTFSTWTIGYSFSGLEGWYISAGTGILKPLNDWVSVALSGNISWSFNYWTASSGCDQLNLLLTFPFKVKKDCEVTPYIMADWGARNAKLINSTTGTKVVENFALVAGVSFTLNF